MFTLIDMMLHGCWVAAYCTCIMQVFESFVDLKLFFPVQIINPAETFGDIVIDYP